MGQDQIKVYRAKIDGVVSQGERSYCAECGSALWLWDPRRPEHVLPYAGVIDTALPASRARSHIMLGRKPEWVEVECATATDSLTSIRMKALPVGLSARVWLGKREALGRPHSMV